MNVVVFINKITADVYPYLARTSFYFLYSFAFIEYSSIDEAEMAFKTHQGETIHGRTIQIKYKKSKTESDKNRIPQYLADEDNEPSTSLMIRNIPISCTKAQIIDMCPGSIAVNFPTRNNGKPRG